MFWLFVSQVIWIREILDMIEVRMMDMTPRVAARKKKIIVPRLGLRNKSRLTMLTVAVIVRCWKEKGYSIVTYLSKCHLIKILHSQCFVFCIKLFYILGVNSCIWQTAIWVHECVLLLDSGFSLDEECSYFSESNIVRCFDHLLGDLFTDW